MFVKLYTAEDIYPKNMKRKAFQKKMPNRAGFDLELKPL